MPNNLKKLADIVMPETKEIEIPGILEACKKIAAEMKKIFKNAQ